MLTASVIRAMTHRPHDEGGKISETSVNVYHTTICIISEDSHVQKPQFVGQEMRKFQILN
jgi:hypothetical protein